MTDPRYAPLGLAAVGRLTEDADDNDTRAVVGADDARADARRAGAETDLAGATRDGDDTPLGSDDAEADRARAAGEPTEESGR